MKALEELGTQILVIELQSALFFGSAERLAQIIEAETVELTRVLILDLRRVTEIDSTGMRILGEIDAELSRRDTALILVLRAGTEAGARLSELPGRRRLPDLDRAIEHGVPDRGPAAGAAPREHVAAARPHLRSGRSPGAASAEARVDRRQHDLRAGRPR
jgi:MFS superfamily sulfate permease-like transporter